MINSIKFKFLVPFVLSVLVTLVVQADSFSPARNPRSRNNVVYGDDNRVNVSHVKDPRLLAFALSTAAKVDHENMEISGSKAKIEAEPLGTRHRLCKEELFKEEPTAASCTGFLVADSVLVTAGHCMDEMDDCSSSSWVFDFDDRSLQNVGVAVVNTNKIYKCAQIIEKAYDGDSRKDYAVIRLDRPVRDRKPLPFRRSGKVPNNASLVVTGHPSGLPMKVADGALIRDNSKPFYFVTNLDTFHGNSGSPVFDLNTGLIEGILVQGEDDYETDKNKGCDRVKVCDPNSCRGEDVTRITIVEAIQKLR